MYVQMKRLKCSRLISVIMIFMIIISSFAMSVVQSEAIAPAIIVVGGVAVFAGLLYGAYAVSGLNADDINTMWDGLSQSIKDGLSDAGRNSTKLSGVGMATVVLGSSLINEFNAWFAGTFPSLSGSVNVGGLLPSNIESYIWSGQKTINSGVMASYNASNQNRILTFNKDQNWPDAEVCFYSYQGQNIRICFNSDNTINLSSSTGMTSYFVSSQGGSLKSTSNILSDGAKLMIVYYSGTFDIVNSSGSVIGSMSTGRGVTYDRSMLFDPVSNALSPGISGEVTINVPYTDNPDTNVTIPPDNSIDNPITLQTVIAGYGSIDNFFEQGGKITLSDGTVISGGTGVHDLTRGGTSVLPDQGTGTIEGDVSGIKSLIHSITGIISAILTAIRDFAKTDSSSWNLDFSGLQVNLFDRFPFCLPFDFMHIVDVFAEQPSDYVFRIKLDAQHLQFDHTVDMSPFMMPIRFFRYVAVIWFIYILVSKTRSLIKW